MSRYAENTEVPVDRSLGQIQTTLKTHGASRFVYGEDDDAFMIGFVMEGRQYRFVVPLPQRTDRDIAYTDTGKARLSSAIPGLLEQGRKQRFRALLLVLKAKLEAIDTGITTLEDEFLSALVLGNGDVTFGQYVRPQLQRIAAGELPSLLALGSGE